MSYIDLAYAECRPAQRTGLGIAVGWGCPSMLRTNGRPTLARSHLIQRAPCGMIGHDRLEITRCKSGSASLLSTVNWASAG
jgi:hypothetical protein